MSSASDRLATLRLQGGFFPVAPCIRARVHGADACRYLNGQLSQNVGTLKPNEARQALMLTAKGKLCAVVFVWRDGEDFLLETNAGLAEEFFPRLERYVVADDVIIDPEPWDSNSWHVFGPAANEQQGLHISRLGVPGRDVSHPPDGLLEASAEEQEILRIERGVPAWGAELGPETLPHEAGLDRTAVDFHKGCYVGQETVSRMESVGRANRVLTGLSGHFPCQPGLTLRTSAGHPAGTLTSVAPHFGMALTVALGYVNSRISESHFVVTDADGNPLGDCQRYEFPLL